MSKNDLNSVIINDAWIKKHGFSVKSYKDFEQAFIIDLRKTVRKRFITDKKKDEFAIIVESKVLGYCIISLEDIGNSIIFRSPL